MLSSLVAAPQPKLSATLQPQPTPSPRRQPRAGGGQAFPCSVGNTGCCSGCWSLAQSASHCCCFRSQWVMSALGIMRPGSQFPFRGPCVSQSSGKVGQRLAAHPHAQQVHPVQISSFGWQTEKEQLPKPRPACLPAQWVAPEPGPPSAIGLGLPVPSCSVPRASPLLLPSPPDHTLQPQFRVPRSWVCCIHLNK